MSRSKEKDIAIVIPARNEERRIGTCLSALAGQCPARVKVIVVVNNSNDQTCERARDTAADCGLHLIALERTLAPDQGVGTARRIGCDHALNTMPDLQYLLTTDADCIVAGDWVKRNLMHLGAVDAVCGKIGLIAQEASVVDAMDRRLATLEGIYRELVQALYARHAPGCRDIRNTHGEAAGASLAFSKRAYLAVGGFEPVMCGEDRKIVRALRSTGHKVRHASDVTVQASCRLTGRAVGGMSDALKARTTGVNYVVDDCLPSADWLITHTKDSRLGPWPPLVPANGRLRVRDLPRHIEMLMQFENSSGVIPASIAAVEPVSITDPGRLQLDRGSATIAADPGLQALLIRKEGRPATTQPKASVNPTAKGA
ncbi:glycosyltransferase [Roseovarius sp. S1116L3]|uniref:glycosyltransferase n=1 Tax=Roseovarius roseus TaxID=3342636 RepID=UPI00372B4CCA